MTERFASEAHLRESEARFRQMVMSIRDAFWLYDIGRDEVVFVNPAWEAMTGHPASVALGTGVSRFAVVTPEDRARVERAFAEQGTVGPLRQEFRIVTAAGATLAVEERSFPVLDDDGRPYRVAGLITDLTQRHRMAEAGQRAQRLAALGQLAGGIAHEFNNLVGSILFAADELADLSRGDDTRRELCGIIINASQRARDLTRHMLAFSGQGSGTRTSVDLNQLVWDIIAVLRRTVDRRVMILGDLRAPRAVVLGDPSQLQSALLDLGVRARDAMPDGGELTFETERVHLDELACASLPFELRVGDYVRVTVSDTGHALTPAQRERIFDPFSDGTPTGGGVGLAAVYGTAVAHAGAIEVYSEPLSGTRCHLYLPLAARAAAATLPPLPEAPAVRGTGLVLVIDDEALLRDALVTILTNLGYTVVATSDAREAIASFRERHAECVAVLCDINLPLLTGPDLVRELRRIDPGVPVVMSSGFAREQTTSQLEGLAIDGYLAKPVRRSELAAVIAAVARKPA